MSASAAHYIPRAPRYVFRPEDESLMRYAGMETNGTATKARIRDLSATGLLIAVSSDDVPWVGDMLKIEFGVPGRRQIAWFAAVARVESRNEWDPDSGNRNVTLVGLKFHRLPEPFQLAIRRSLKNLVPKPEESAIVANDASLKEKALFWGASALMLALFVVMSIPTKHWFH